MLSMETEHYHLNMSHASKEVGPLLVLSSKQRSIPRCLLCSFLDFNLDSTAFFLGRNFIQTGVNGFHRTLIILDNL